MKSGTAGQTLRYALGIDFGTSHSRVSYFNPVTEEATLLRFRSNVDGFRQYSIPSLVVWNGDDWLYGYEADEFRNSAAWDDARCAEYQSLKRELVTPDRPLDGLPPRVTPLTVNAAIGQLLRYIVGHADQALRALFRDFEIERSSISVSVPVFFDDAARDRLLTAYKEALGRDGEPSLVVNEPTAAGMARFQLPAKFPPGGTVVLDAGAGTTDISVFNRHDDALYVVSAQAVGVGGDAVDAELMNLVKTRLRALGVAVDQHGMRTLIERQIRQVRRAKENLSDVERTGCILNTPAAVNVDITRRELEQAIERPVEEITAALRRALDTAEAQFRLTHQPFDLSHVMLVGGSSYIPCLKRRVEQTIGEWSAVRGKGGRGVKVFVIQALPGALTEGALAAVGLGTSYPAGRFVEIKLGSVPYETELALGKNRTKIIPIFSQYQQLPATKTFGPITTRRFPDHEATIVFRQAGVIRQEIKIRLGLIDNPELDVDLRFSFELSQSGGFAVKMAFGKRQLRERFRSQLPWYELLARRDDTYKTWWREPGTDFSIEGSAMED